MSFRHMKFSAALLALCLCLFAGSAQAAAQKTHPGMDGKGLVDLLAKNEGKVVLVNVFASWCPPCAKEVPAFITLRKNFAEKDLLIIAVSVDDDLAELNEFLGKYAVNYPIYTAKGNFREAVGVSTIPQLMLFNRAGEMVTNHRGYVDEETLTKALEDLVKE